MLPSSSDLGRQPPQAGNGGLNPSGSAIPAYTYINACPWSGAPCECKTFPFRGANDTLPQSCSDLIRDKLPAMIPFRKLLPSSSDLGRQPPQAGNGGLNPSGSAKLKGVTK